MFVYADNATTTKISKRTLEKMLPFYKNIYGNPSSFHTVGQQAKNELEKAREEIAEIIGVNAKEIYFTSSGSESNNQAIISAARIGAKNGKKQIISSKFEHQSVLQTLNKLKKEGFEIILVDVYKNGIVKTEDVKKVITNNTALVTIMAANHEIGTIQPIKEIAEICKEQNVIFHTDASQIVGHINFNIKKLGVDMISFSAHKFHGPKGVGVLYSRLGISLTNLIEGGAQERGKRAGTENLPAIIGMTEALKQATDNLEINSTKTIELRKRLIKGLKVIQHSSLIGDKNFRLPGIVGFCFEGIKSEMLLSILDENEIVVSSNLNYPSHALLAMGFSQEFAQGFLQISINEENTEEQIDYIITSVKETVDYLRKTL